MNITQYYKIYYLNIFNMQMSAFLNDVLVYALSTGLGPLLMNDCINAEWHGVDQAVALPLLRLLRERPSARLHCWVS